MPNPYTLLSEIPKQAKYDFKTIGTEGAPGSPQQPPILITLEEPWVLITVEGVPISQFLLDTGVTFSVLTEAPGLLSFQSTTIMGLSG